MVAFESAINSASTVDNATVSCLLLFYETRPPETRKILLLVDHLIVLYPAKSKST